MEPKQNYLVVGIFVLLAVAGFFAFVVWLSNTGEQRNYVLYRTYFTDSVTGLSNGASVKYRGVDVGKVQSIAIDKTNAVRVLITMRIEETTPITRDTVAVLKMMGITGVAYVDLTTENSDGPPIAHEEGEIPVIASKPSELSQIMSSVPEILDRFSRVTEQLMALMSEENIARVSNSLDNVERVTAALSDNSGEIAGALKDLRKAMNQLSATAGTLNNLADSSRTDVENALKQTSLAMEQLTALLTRTNQFSEGGYRDLGALLVEMKKTARELRELTQSVKEEPSRLIVPPKPGGVKIP